MRMPAARATRRISASRARPCSPSSPKPALSTIAKRTPRAAQCPTASSTAGAGTTMTATVGAACGGRSRTLGQQGRPSISRCAGLTRWSSPRNSPWTVRLSSVRRPRLPGRSDAPTSTTERGPKSSARSSKTGGMPPDSCICLPGSREGSALPAHGRVDPGRQGSCGEPAPVEARRLTRSRSTMNDRTAVHLLEPCADGAPARAFAPGEDDAPWLAGLNPAQHAAARWGARQADGPFRAGPQLVIAGAGTGKTAMLAHRVAHLVMSGVAPERIALLTFSRRAAQEMIRRAESLVGKALAERARGRAGRATPVAFRLPWSGTFHAVGARLLREHAERIGLDPDFGILDRGDAADLLDQLRHEQGLSSQRRRFPRKETCLAIYSFAVNAGWPLERVLERNFPWCVEWAEELRALFRGYVDRKLAHGVLDYDDLLLWWETAVSDAGLAAEIGARFDHVLVDEYQDTNALQARILLAMKPDGDGLTVVGDDAQSIYAFRAADVDNILGFPGRFDPPARQVTLDANYRSRQPIL